MTNKVPMRPYIQFLILSSIMLLSGSCRKETSFEGGAYTLRLRFRPSANGENLRFNREYFNPVGEDYKVSAFKIYISHLELLDESDRPVDSFPDKILLLDAADSNTLKTDLQVNEKPFKRIVFRIGIDSVLNVSGAQTGPLDPLKGMFWTWNTGYINAKLEGSSFFSTGPNKSFTYHIGGFREGENTQRNVSLEMPNQQVWVVEKSGRSEAVIGIEIDNWFRSVHDLPIGLMPQQMEPGPVAMRYADNYATMFSLESIKKQ
jgi:hypothetical protein